MAYYSLVAHCLPGSTVEEIDQVALGPIRSLPDEPFFDATGGFLMSVDRVHFGNGILGEEGALKIRTSLAGRLLESSGWRSGSSDPSRSMEVHMGSVIAALLFNEWNRLSPSSCHLLPTDIDRIRSIPASPGAFGCGGSGRGSCRVSFLTWTRSLRGWSISSLSLQPPRHGWRRIPITRLSGSTQVLLGTLAALSWGSGITSRTRLGILGCGTAWAIFSPF